MTNSRTISHALFLLIDERTCACGALYTCPNPRLSLQTIRRDSNGHARSYMTPWSGAIPEGIPCARHVIHSALEICPSCFVEVEGPIDAVLPQKDLPLAARTPLPTRAPRAPLVPATALSDF